MAMVKVLHARKISVLALDGNGIKVERGGRWVDLSERKRRSGREREKGTGLGPSEKA